MIENKIKAIIDGNNNIVIENSDGNEITINTNNPLEVKKIVGDLGKKLELLPNKILSMLADVNTHDVEISGTRLYLTFAAEFSPNRLGKMRISTTITNLNKIHRYYSVPYFKLETSKSLPDDFPFDTFQLVQIGIDKTIYPARLEFGQPISSYFEISDVAIDLFKKCPPDTKLKAFVTNTVGELIESNDQEVHKMIENYNSILE